MGVGSIGKLTALHVIGLKKELRVSSTLRVDMIAHGMTDR